MVEQQNNGRALIGFMEEQEAINFLKSVCVPSENSDDELRGIWRKANSEIKALSLPDLTPEIIDINDSYKELIDNVSKSPYLLNAVQDRKWEVKLVEIDKLVCFQQYIHTDYPAEIIKECDFNKTKDLIDFCLPRQQINKPALGEMSNQQEHVHTFFSPSMDLRISGHITGEQNNQKIVGFSVDWGNPYIQVVKYEGRYFLKNGYHRAYILRKNGIKHIPCILTEGKTYEDTGANRPGFFSNALTMSDNPPIFERFFSDAVAPHIQLRPITKIIRIKAEEYVLPDIVQYPLPKKEINVRPPDTREISITMNDTEYEDFKIQKEDWNIYKLRDGTIIKVRNILLKLKKMPKIDSMPQMFSISPQLLLAIIPPSNQKGAPSTHQYTPEELTAFVTETNMPYDAIQEVTNEYITKSGDIITLRIASVNISKTSKFDEMGEPKYLVNTQLEIQNNPFNQS